MGTRANQRWQETFPYRDGRVVVERLADGWRVQLECKEALAKTLVEALESVRNQRAGDAELDVVLAALIHDRMHTS
jgi:tryptophanyl-tRNA synthetase